MSANIPVLSDDDVFLEEEDDATVINPAPEGCPTATTINEVQSDADFSASENDDDDEWDPLIPPGGFMPLPPIPEEQPPHIPVGPNAGWFCHICGYDNMLVDHLCCRICGRPPDARDLKETPDITLNEPLLEDVPSTVEVWQCGGCSTMNDFIAGQEVHTCLQCQRVVDSTNEVFLSFSIPEADYAEIAAQLKEPSPPPNSWGQASAVPFGGGLVRPTGPASSWEASQNFSFSAQTPSNNGFNSKWQSGEVSSSPTHSQQWPSFSPPPDLDFFGCDTPEPLLVEDDDTEPQPVVDPAAPVFKSLGPAAAEQPSSLLMRSSPSEDDPCAESDSCSSTEPTTMDEDGYILVRKRGFESVMCDDEHTGEAERPKKKRRVSPPPIDGSATAGEGAGVVMSDGGEFEDASEEAYQSDENTTER